MVESTEAMAARSAHRAELEDEWVAKHGFEWAEVSTVPGLSLAMDSFVAEKLRAEAEAKAWAKADPISGLTPRFRPNAPLPDGAVLVWLCPGGPDCYWTPNGSTGWHVHSIGVVEEHDTGDAINHARALGLPLAGDGLAEGEEAFTDERLAAMNPPWYSVATADPHCHGCLMLGLDNLRRWKLGWICRPAPPAPSAEEQLAAALRRVDELVNAGLVDKAEIERLKGEVAEREAQLQLVDTALLKASDVMGKLLAEVAAATGGA